MKTKEELSIIHRYAPWGLYYSEENNLVDWLSDSYNVQIYDWKETDPNILTGKNVWLRCPKDYLSKRQEFMNWYQTIGRISHVAINNPETVENGLNKEYLLHFAASVPVVLSQLIHSIDELEECSLHREELILKPIYGESGKGVIRINKKTSRKHLVNHLETHGPCLLQPFMEGIHDGEISIYFFNNNYSYAIRSKPSTPRQYKVSWQHVEQCFPEHNLITLSAEAYNQWPYPVDYARLDWVKDHGKYFLSEFEVIDPMLNLRWIDDKTRGELLNAINKMFIRRHV